MKENIVQKIFKEALKDSTFRSALADNAATAIQGKGWEVSKEDLRIIEKILGMSVKQLIDHIAAGSVPPPPPPWIGDDLFAYLKRVLR